MKGSKITHAFEGGFALQTACGECPGKCKRVVVTNRWPTTSIANIGEVSCRECLKAIQLASVQQIEDAKRFVDSATARLVELNS